ncbi:hypothetical protein FQ085_02655 [Planococcus sp. ANT_H30]|nr:hypothetical protein FQ085_02655 [Planococcus sp. ANT_H30]
MESEVASPVGDCTSLFSLIRLCLQSEQQPIYRLLFYLLFVVARFANSKVNSVPFPFSESTKI